MSGSRASAASAVLLGGALAGVAFGAAGGTELTRTSIVEVAMVLVGGSVVATALLVGRRAPVHGAVALVLFAALAAFTALAVLWSVVPELTYVEAGRTLAYLAIFAAALAAARIAPRGAPAVLHGILLGAVAALLYALASRIWPGALAETELSNRIGQPFQYWNAVGTTAAIVVPIALWLGARRVGSAALRAAAYPALGLAVLAILLTQSRGALLAAALGALLWFAFVPLRLRSLPVLVLPSSGAALVGAWALSKDPFSRPLQPLAAKESVAGEFGLLVALLIVVLFLAGLAVDAGVARGLPPVRLRRRIGIVVSVVACALPLVAFTSVAFSDRGLGGTIEDRVDELTSETDTAPAEGAGRIGSASNTRGKYWREAGRVFAHRRAVGTGPGTFRVARLRERTDAGVTAHAHGFVPQTLADMGLVGLALTLALLVAWLVAAARSAALHPRRLRLPRKASEPLPRRDWDGDRVALVALVLVAVVFGLQSAIDWTWFVPGPAAMALVAAGFVAGRGPAAALGSAGPELDRATVRLPALGARVARPERPRLVAAAGLLLATLLCAWAVWQPEASDRASNDALALIDARDFEAAIAKARDAADANPLTPRPLLVEAAAQAAAGSEAGAATTLERAVLRYPGDPRTWERLASYQLETLDRPREALSTVRGALYLDPHSPRAHQLFLDARVRSREQATSAAARSS